MAKRSSDFATQLALVNVRLKLGGLGLQVEQRGQRLSLRGVLPPRPGNHQRQPHQQRLALKLPATVEGLKRAEQEAKIIAAALIQNTFNWQQYQIHLQVQSQGGRTWDYQYEAFREFFFTQPDRLTKPASSRSTWRLTYQPYLLKLGQVVAANPHWPLTLAIPATLETFPYGSRSRQICCTALTALANFLNLEIDPPLQTLAGNYNRGKVKPRQLPTDKEIEHLYGQIPNPHWRLVYGLMATYGLRNHEVFFCDLRGLRDGDPEASIQVLEATKTGEHEVWPFWLEWVDRFRLRDLELPPITCDLQKTTLQAIGQQVNCQFRRYHLPFSPYSLRHAWAVRTIHLGLPDTVAAKMMGHSVHIHNHTYHRWITRRDQQRAVATARLGSALPHA